jgi:hypothetical protein
MDVDAGDLFHAIRDAMDRGDAGADGHVLLTGPDAPLFLSRLEEQGPTLPSPALDPLCRKGRGLELLAVAKTREIVDTHKRGDVMSGPEYIRKSDAG